MNTFAPILDTATERRLAQMLIEDATTCDNCGGENLSDGILCMECRPLKHYSHPKVKCYCPACEREEREAVAAMGDGTLVIKKAA